MTELLDTIYNVITPIILAVGVGAIYGYYFRPEPKVLSGVVIYIFSPCMILEGMTNADINSDELAQITAWVFTTAGLMAIIGLIFSRLLGLDKRRESAFMLSVVIFNGATYGIPFNEFAFGYDARQLAVVYFSVMVIVTNTFGVYLASRGTSASARMAILNIVKLPPLYAAFIGLFLNFSAIALVISPDDIVAGQLFIPIPLARTIHSLAAAAIPVMAVLLGIQLQRSRFNVKQLIPVLVASATALLVAPLVAALFAPLFGVHGLSRQVGIMQFAMPTAIVTTVLATEFGGDTEFVTSVVLISTLGSILTLSVLLLFV